MADKITVAFLYEAAKGNFVPVPDWKPGGAPLAIYMLATELAKDQSFDVRVIVDPPVPAERVEGVQLVGRRAMIKHGVPGLSRIINRQRKAAGFARERFVLVSTVARPDLLPVYQPVVHAMGGKTLYRIASDWDVKPEERGSDGSDEFTRALLEADAVVAQTSEQERALLARYGKSSTVVEPGFRIPRGRPTAVKDIILWVGQAYPYKRPWVCLDAARALPDEKFVMIMPDMSNGLFEAIATEAEHCPNVEIIESVPFDETQAFFDRAKILLNTSTLEGFPNTLHQAAIGMTATLSLLWDGGGYLPDSGVGLCANGSTDDFVRLLRELIRDEDRRRFMGEVARRRVEQHNDVAVTAECYKTIFRSLVDSAG